MPLNKPSLYNKKIKRLEIRKKLKLGSSYVWKLEIYNICFL